MGSPEPAPRYDKHSPASGMIQVKSSACAQVLTKCCLSSGNGRRGAILGAVAPWGEVAIHADVGDVQISFEESLFFVHVFTRDGQRRCINETKGARAITLEGQTSHNVSPKAAVQVGRLESRLKTGDRVSCDIEPFTIIHHDALMGSARGSAMRRVREVNWRSTSEAKGPNDVLTLKCHHPRLTGEVGKEGLRRDLEGNQQVSRLATSFGVMASVEVFFGVRSRGWDPPKICQPRGGGPREEAASLERVSW